MGENPIFYVFWDFFAQIGWGTGWGNRLQGISPSLPILSAAPANATFILPNSDSITTYQKSVWYFDLIIWFNIKIYKNTFIAYYFLFSIILSKNWILVSSKAIFYRFLANFWSNQDSEEELMNKQTKWKRTYFTFT